MIRFDPEKDKANRAKHGFGLAQASRFELVAVFDDDRKDYGERRRRAFGFIDGEPVVFVYTVREDHIRAISLRRAHDKEFRRHGLPAPRRSH